MITLSTFLFGIGASLATEVITWLNSKLSGTTLKGDGAFILAAVVALAAAGVHTYIVPTVTWQLFIAQASTIWASSQAFFIVVIQLLKLDVPSTPSTTAPTAPLG